MENGTTIIQKKLGVKLTFLFDEDKLTRTIADYSGENQFSVFYETIDVENPSTLTVNNGRRYARLIVMLFIFLGIFFAIESVNKIVLDALILLDLFFIVLIVIGSFFKRFAIKYTVLQIPNKNGINTIRIIHGAMTRSGV